jgi:hypothetical protein
LPPQPSIAPTVDFTVIAREVRCKWSPDADKASLVAAQAALAEALPSLKAGGRSVKRVVCGGCMDFKIVTSCGAEAFGAFEEGGFAGEEALVEKLKAIEGVSEVETQTYTFEDM